MNFRWLLLAASLAFVSFAGRGGAAEHLGAADTVKSPGGIPGVASPVVYDRVVARFSDPEVDDPTTPSRLTFVMMRELTVEAWLAAFERTAQEGPPSSYEERDLRVALDRHVVEALLSRRPQAPMMHAKATAALRDARNVLAASVGGETRLRLALDNATGTRRPDSGGSAPVETLELDAILKRRIRAEAYLEKVLFPSAEALEADALRGSSPRLGPDEPRESKTDESDLRARAARLHDHAISYYQSTRARLRLEFQYR